ncbi:DUF2381 family protein [Corallococcus exiguus]|uniref:DUF2381 family protein n=1 Tax=Corallococcus exiguus TaxID=83462 RepID=A0A7X4Y5U6_9BACT|nr:DUF2381 family protein [Corallococcus exiguus]NBC38362.1 DUF2381 family protein [Corallococcus exiguus]
MLLFLVPFLAAADGGASDKQACTDVGLAVLLSEKILGQGGVQTLEMEELVTSPSGGDFRVRSFRSVRRVAVQLEFSGGMPLSGKATRAVLSGPNHQALKVVEVIERDPDSEIGSAMIIVEAEAQPREARGVYTLELLDAEGTRLLVLPGVRFPSI